MSDRGSKKGWDYGGVVILTHAEKCQLAAKRRMKGVPPTPPQALVLAAIKGIPGLRVPDYAALAFGYNTYFNKKKTTAALQGLLSRGLVFLYPACHCGFPLTPYGKRSHKCNACGSFSANVHVKADRIGAV